MAQKAITHGSLTWTNIDKVNDELLASLKKQYNFHHLDIEDIQGERQTPKIDTYKHYLFLVIHFPHWDAQLKAVRTQEVYVFIGKDYLITIQKELSKEMKQLFYRCMKNTRVKKEWMNSSSGYLLYNILESLFKHSQIILNNIGKHLYALENDIFEEDVNTRTVKELAVHRRNVLSFRRIIDPQRYLMANLSHIRKPFLEEEMSVYFDDVHDFLTKLWSIVDTYKETIEGFHVTVESLLAQKTNKVIRTLTIISVALLPYTVLASVYGMNIDSLPFAHNPLWVWGMFLVLTLALFITIGVMKWRKML